MYPSSVPLSEYEAQIEIGNVPTTFEPYFYGIPETELGKSVVLSKVKDDFDSTDKTEVLSAPKGKQLNDRLIINEDILEGKIFEVLSSENIEVEDFTYSIDTTGTVTGTKTNGRVFPFFRLPTATEIKFQVTSSSPFVILGGDETSVIAIGVQNGARSLLYRFTNGDDLTLLEVIDIGSSIDDTVGRITYKQGVYKVYSNNVLKATILSTDLSAYPESLKPVLGLIVYNPFVSIPNLTAIVKDRVTYIESKVSSTQANPFKGLKYTSIGDSIEAANATQPLIVGALELGDFQNLAISGTTLTNNGANSGCFKYLEIDSDTRLITCNYGTNDVGLSLPLGSFGDTTNATFYGTLKIVTEGLVTNHPLARIFFYTIQQLKIIAALLKHNCD
jgi:hypothetical protein